MIQFDESVCRNLDAASRREWLETNGIGGFASSTITGLNTRRYHGLLVAATKPPVGRMVLLSKMEETLVIDGRRFDLSCNRYPGVIHPEGYRYLKQFRRDPFAIFVFEAGGLELEKSVFMVYGENTTVIQYALRGAPQSACILELRPLIAFRDYHSTTHENGAINRRLEIESGCVMCSPYQGCPNLYLAHSSADLRQDGGWYRNFEYSVEEARGLDYREDLYNPMALTFDLRRDAQVSVIASTEARSAESAGCCAQRKSGGVPSIVARAPSDDSLVRSLFQAADQFIVQRGDERPSSPDTTGSAIGAATR